MASGEKEEEEAFLVSLYKFMKERHTPIERIPHLGFKQSTAPRGGGGVRFGEGVRARSGAGGRCALLTPSPLFPVNLWKIYKAVEKLGAYELVSSQGAPMGAVWHPKGVLGFRF